MSPAARIGLWKVTVPVAAKNKFRLVCTRPLKSKSGPGKKLRSLSENTPNWKMGIRATSTWRIMFTVSPVGRNAPTCIIKGTTCACKPALGPWEMLCTRDGGELQEVNKVPSDSVIVYFAYVT